jgi:hypothetical protein
MEKAAAKQLESLRGEGLLNASHGMLEQLIMDLARAVGHSAAAGRGSALAMASKELREAMFLLPVQAGPADPWTAFQDDLAKAGASGNVSRETFR